MYLIPSAKGALPLTRNVPSWRTQMAPIFVAAASTSALSPICTRPARPADWGRLRRAGCLVLQHQDAA